jgi:putative transposase
MLLVYRYRVKSLTGELNRQARAVNYVWNYCNDVQKHALQWNQQWPSGFDLNKLTTGSSKELRLHSGTINATCEQYAKSRSQKCRPYLRYRGKKALAWVPLKGRDLKVDGDGFVFHGRRYRVFLSRPLPEGVKIKDGTNFSRDAQGRWFLNVTVELPDAAPRPAVRVVAIDPGLTTLATLSTGEKIDNPKHYAKIEAGLGKAQRAHKQRQVKKLHAQCANARRDYLHKQTTRLVREFDYLAVGDVCAARLAKTSMAKSVLDASWSSFRNMLRYKAIAHGATYEEVSERGSSQVCSRCGALPDTRPKGIADLGIRQWICSGCGCEHDRDVNAALILLAPCALWVAADMQRQLWESPLGRGGCQAMSTSSL